jgi:hypothetical protein
MDGMAQYREKWRSIVEAVMNLQVPLNAGKFFVIFTLDKVLMKLRRMRCAGHVARMEGIVY